MSRSSRADGRKFDDDRRPNGGKECKLTIHMQEEDEGNFLVVEVCDKLTNSDFESLAPEFQRLVQHRGKVRVLYELNHFHGWDAQALWDEIKFNFRNFADVERIAIVGDEKWEH